ncbi:MAG TPA: hypothetical protein VHF22_12140, partial [Planctomycetota bacterium]|nr:hypothetical protein [Planctomycetota bacterium]
PGRFSLRLYDALELEGRVAPGASALLLLRRDNAPEHGYLWVLGRAALGPEPAAALRLAGPGSIERDGTALLLRLPPGAAAAPSEVGDEARYP